MELCLLLVCACFVSNGCCCAAIFVVASQLAEHAERCEATTYNRQNERKQSNRQALDHAQSYILQPEGGMQLYSLTRRTERRAPLATLWYHRYTGVHIAQ